MSETEAAGGKPIPPTANNIRAVAHSALVEALPEWMKLSDRVRVSDAVVAAVEPMIRASERERIRQLAAGHEAVYDETVPCNCGRVLPGGRPCTVRLRSDLPFADLIGEEA